jgi:hypothetical protein
MSLFVFFFFFQLYIWVQRWREREREGEEKNERKKEKSWKLFPTQSRFFSFITLYCIYIYVFFCDSKEKKRRRKSAGKWIAHICMYIYMRIYLCIPFSFVVIVNVWVCIADRKRAREKEMRREEEINKHTQYVRVCQPKMQQRRRSRNDYRWRASIIHMLSVRC